MTCRVSRVDIIERVNEIVRTAVATNNLAGARLVVAVSGGPDSLTLLHALCAVTDCLDLTLHAVHLDHGLRGTCATEDAHFAAELFQSLNIPHTVEKIDVAGHQRDNSVSLELAARELRYAALARIVTATRSDAIALGHTADDQAETVLMNVIRGTGLSGLTGMESVSKRHVKSTTTTLIRPLLPIRRRDITAYCDALQLEPRTDSTNFSTKYRRNSVRLELIPMMERYNPAIVEALLRLSNLARQDARYIASALDAVWNTVTSADRSIPDSITIDTKAFAQLPPALGSRLLRKAIRKVKGDLSGIEQIHIESMKTLTLGSAGRSTDLPGGLRYTIGYGYAILADRKQALCPLPVIDGEYIIKVPGTTQLPGWRITASLPKNSSRIIVRNKNAFIQTFDHQSLPDNLVVRARRAGDRFQPLGMPKSKKLHDFMIDASIAHWDRDCIPIVESSRGIIWVVGWQIAEWAKVREESHGQLILQFDQRIYFPENLHPKASG